MTIINRILKNVFKESNSLSFLYKERLKETGLKNYHVAKLLGIDRKSLKPIIEGTAKQVDMIKLIKISEFLNINLNEMLSSFFKDMEKDEISELEKVRKVSFVLKHFDLLKLKEIGFISKIDDIDYIENRLCTFFSLSNIYEYDRELNAVLYSKTKKSYTNPMVTFWVKSAYSYFNELDNPNEYNRDLLIEIIPKLRLYTQDIKKGLIKIAKALFNAGVTVIFQKHLPNTQVRGATFLINGKPCIVLTDLNKNYATIWFALVHELHHVLYDLDVIESASYHLTGELDLFLIEDRANEFARELLFSKAKMKNIKPFIHNHFLVQEYAKEVKVHPCIIYAFFQYDTDNYWGAFKKFFPDVNEITKNLNVGLWEEESIVKSVSKIKEIFSN
jgi:HTH-type transcriptional regulator/antitoxin HigA